MSVSSQVNGANERKVLYIIDTLQVGGAEKSILDISSKLAQFKPVVCQLYENDGLTDEFRKRGVEVIKLRSDRYNFIRTYRALRKVLRREKPSLVVATLMHSELISRVACWWSGIINVGTFVNDTYSDHEWRVLSFSMRLKIGFVWMLNMATARLCRGFLSNAESIKRSNCKALLVPTSKVEVIYRGRRPDVFAFSDNRFTQQPTKFLVVSRLLARKGYHELIVAFDAFHKVFPQSTLTIAGEGPYRSTIESMIEGYQIQHAVDLLGVAHDIPGLMKTHDCLLFPSHYEGFSGTLIEAMLSGLPIIASDIEMNKEAVTHNETARLFEVKNSASLFDNMVWAMQNRDLVIQMAHRARQIAEERFDIDAIARQHESYYHRITADV